MRRRDVHPDVVFDQLAHGTGPRNDAPSEKKKAMTDPADPSSDDAGGDARLDPTELPIFGGSGEPSAPEPIDLTATRRSHLHPVREAKGQRRRTQPDALAGPISINVVPATKPPSAASAPGITAYLRSEPGQLGQPASSTAPADMDWNQVAVFRSQASDQLTAALRNERDIDAETQRELGRSIIQELLQAAVADQLHEGRASWSLDEQNALAEAIFNALFDLGRLQPLLDTDDAENIMIAGQDVWLEKTNGDLVRANAVADSEDELLDFLSFIASRSEANARSFSAANPRLHLRLDDGSRLAAVAWVTSRPGVVIRRHRLRKVVLEDLVERDMISPILASFLRAAVRAGKSIVVAGAQAAGKTTLVRALCSEIPPWEAIGTFETEHELFLKDILPNIVYDWEARPGSGEYGPDGRPAGLFTISEALFDSFRFNLRRQIIGEVRGSEVWDMIKAMESGTGSISTTHAASAEAAMRKLVTCAMEAGPHISRELATSKLAETIDLIVQVTVQTTRLDDDRFSRSRWVSEILHVTPGEVAKGYATTQVFRPNPAGGPALPGILPDELRALERDGFDLTSYLAEDGREEELTA